MKGLLDDRELRILLASAQETILLITINLLNNSLHRLLRVPLKLEIINVKLSPLRDDDVKAIVDIELHPAVRRWLVDYVYEDYDKELEDYKRFFQEVQSSDKVEVLIAKVDGRVIGFLALWRMDEYEEHVRSIGISVHPEYWGRGVATRLVKEAIELARKIGTERVMIETLEENIAMRRVAEKLNFKLEGVRENKVFKDGSCHNEYVYSLRL